MSKESVSAAGAADAPEKRAIDHKYERSQVQ